MEARLEQKINEACISFEKKPQEVAQVNSSYPFLHVTAAAALVAGAALDSITASQGQAGFGLLGQGTRDVTATWTWLRSSQ